MEKDFSPDQAQQDSNAADVGGLHQVTEAVGLQPFH